MRMLSDDAAGVLYLDVAALDGDDDLRDLRRSVESDWDFDSYDLDLRDLDYVAFSEEDGGGDVFLLSGVDDRDLRDELDDRDYDEDEISGVEVWVDSSSTWEAFAFLPGGAVLIAYYEDDMEDMLRRRDRGGSSLDDELGDLWRELPSGHTRVVGQGCDYADCDFIGISFEKKNSREVRIVLVLEFDSERDAERAEEDVEEDVEESVLDDEDCGDVDVRQDGRRVWAEGDCDIEGNDSFNGFGF